MKSVARHAVITNQNQNSGGSHKAPWGIRQLGIELLSIAVWSMYGSRTHTWNSGVHTEDTSDQQLERDDGCQCTKLLEQLKSSNAATHGE